VVWSAIGVWHICHSWEYLSKMGACIKASDRDGSHPAIDFCFQRTIT
jgi:hypothetical protein